jgi:hypothetical protein
MHNCLLAVRTARDIDRRVSKLLADLDCPEPPLRLEVARDLLKLDRAYYSRSDRTVLADTIHRLKIAGRQIALRPSLLLDVVTRLDLKALWVPDRKRILIDSDLPAVKQRWGEAHEICHSILPWHGTVLHGDKARTLSLACQQQVEAEANYGAGRLLFLQDLLTERVRSSPLTFGHVRKLSKEFGNSITSTLWRAIESVDASVFGLVSQHPLEVPSDTPVRYFLRSSLFIREFEGITATAVFGCLGSFCTRRRGPIGAGEVIFVDTKGERHAFSVEVFFNGHEALTLGVHARNIGRR